MLCNGISLDIRCLESIGFLNELFFNVPSYNILYNFAIDRVNAISHTRLRLDACPLNYHLFKIGCREFPFCFCGFHTEIVMHFSFDCSVYSALRKKLLSHLQTGVCPHHI